jgi:type II secretory pathway pseudopilin PulG
MSPLTMSRIRVRARQGERGFTLLELLVATVAGMFVVLAAFLLSRGATRLMTSESRIGAAQQNLRLGADRLRSDLERASYMTSPNAAIDPDICPAPAFTYLQGITYVPRTSGATQSKDAANGLNPDTIVLMGNFTSSDLYPVADIDTASGGGFSIYLQATQPAVKRLLNVGSSGSQSEAVSAVFPTGRLLRLTNVKGSSQLLKIAGASVGAGNQPIIAVADVPAPKKSSEGTNKRCGYDGNGNQSTINPVSIVQYDVNTLASNANFGWAYPSDIPADAFKYDLVRRELDSAGSVIAGTEEIVAEYAVDLGFAFSVDTSLPAADGAYVAPSLAVYAFGDSANDSIAANVTTATGSANPRPHRIRSVRYRLSTRSRDPDRNAAIGATGPMLGRYAVGGGYARVRTVTGEVSIFNQQGLRW